MVLPPSFDPTRAEVGPRGPRERAGVEPAVLEEAVVLGRQHRVDQDPRHLVEPDRPMVLAGRSNALASTSRSSARSATSWPARVTRWMRSSTTWRRTSSALAPRSSVARG
jgi:hypothetical protein